MKYVTYLRVSTGQQARSGLGLEAQRANVKRYAQQTQGDILTEFVETESGKRNDRPKLSEALAYAKRNRATLVIATLDRLARKVYFVSGLMESKVPFVCVDSPDAGPLELHMRAAFAEEEGRKISERTRNALAAAKARGTLLGGSNPACRNLSANDRQRAHAANRAKAEAFHAALLPTMVDLRESGHTLQEIADTLNGDGHATQRGLAWSPTAVMRVLDRA